MQLVPHSAAGAPDTDDKGGPAPPTSTQDIIPLGAPSAYGWLRWQRDWLGISVALLLAFRPTRAQIAVVSLVSVLALTVAVIFAAAVFPHHMTNNNVEEQDAGGLTMIINVTP